MEVTFRSIHFEVPHAVWLIGGSVFLLWVGGFWCAPTAQGMPQQRTGGAPQSYEQSRTERLESRQNSAERLPEWAEPQSGGPGYGASSSKDGISTQDGHNPPPDPDPIPVDGGLSLLAAVGAGYALRKLRKEEEDE